MKSSQLKLVYLTLDQKLLLIDAVIKSQFSYCSLIWMLRSSHQRCSAKKVFLEISRNSQETTCARISFLIKLQAAPATLLKKRLWHRCFPVNFTKSIRTPFLRNISGSCFLSIPQATPKLSCGEYEYIYLEPKNCFAHENCVINSGLSWRKVVLKMSAKFLKNTCKGVLFSI